MRSIKIRAKNEVTGEWIYGGGVLTIQDKTIMLHEQPENSPCVTTVDPETVGQFTGLKDKNGKEAYEGDLLKISMQGDIQVGFYEIENLWDLRVAMEDRDSYVRIDRDFEIVGNRYENPELLTT